MASPILSRREAVASLLALASVGAMSACRESTENGGVAEVSTGYADGANFLSADEMAMVAAIADTIIPDTDTPGAVAAGVPAVIQGLASDWGDDEYRKYMRGGLAQLGDKLRREAGQDFANLSPARRESLLAKIDAGAFARPKPEIYSEQTATEDDEAGYGSADGETIPDEAIKAENLQNEFYRAFKNTVATAYYMSEIGATEELAYEAVPGEWIGDAPLSQYPKTWAT